MPIRRPAEDFRVALDDLLNRLERAGIAADIYLLGGAALALGHHARSTITDVDATIRCTADLSTLITEVGAAHGLASDWLNTNVAMYLSPLVDDPAPVEIAVAGGSCVRAASLEILAPMKIRAGRMSIDRDDLEFLFDRLQIRTEEEAIELFERHYPEDDLTVRSLRLIRAVLAHEPVVAPSDLARVPPEPSAAKAVDTGLER